jgi:hypothetical protein
MGVREEKMNGRGIGEIRGVVEEMEVMFRCSSGKYL